eukprot:4956588-Amphidinium_carterae.1
MELLSALANVVLFRSALIYYVNFCILWVLTLSANRQAKSILFLTIFTRLTTWIPCKGKLAPLKTYVNWTLGMPNHLPVLLQWVQRLRSYVEFSNRAPAQDVVPQTPACALGIGGIRGQRSPFKQEVFPIPMNQQHEWSGNTTTGAKETLNW